MCVTVIKINRHKYKYTTMNAVCLICFRPNDIWCEFLSGFTSYKVYIIADDPDFVTMEYKQKYPNIGFVKIPSSYCLMKGYKHMNYTVKKEVTGWEKAMAYFSIFNTVKHDHIWFIEDDVFFYDENTLRMIDEKYETEDLLSNEIHVNADGNRDIGNWMWFLVDTVYPPPYYCGMMCCIRLSNQMMKCIGNYASKYRTLFFLEAMFPTIAMHNNLICKTPDELREIKYDKVFDETNVNKTTVCHPVKNMEHHIKFRDHLNN